MSVCKTMLVQYYLQSFVKAFLFYFKIILSLKMICLFLVTLGYEMGPYQQ